LQGCRFAVDNGLMILLDYKKYAFHLNFWPIQIVIAEIKAHAPFSDVFIMHLYDLYHSEVGDFEIEGWHK
jgi:hypothetical protein